MSTGCRCTATGRRFEATGIDRGPQPVASLIGAPSASSAQTAGHVPMAGGWPAGFVGAFRSCQQGAALPRDDAHQGMFALSPVIVKFSGICRFGVVRESLDSLM